MEEHLAGSGVVRAPDIHLMNQGVDRSKEGTVQPTTTLRDKLGNGAGHIGLTVGRLDVLENPGTVSLGYQLEAQNTILGQVHVGGENVGIRAVELFTQKVFLKGTLTGGVVLEGAVAVGGEGSWQDGNITKDRLERLVKNVGHLVLKVLGGDQGRQQLTASTTQHGTNLSTSASDVGVEIEGLPEMVDGG